MPINLRGKDKHGIFATPLAGVFIVVLAIVLFLMWLGFVVAFTKLVMG